MSVSINALRAKNAKSNPSKWNTLTICMHMRTECGYCQGNRLYTLAMDNPRPSPRGEPSIVVLPIEGEATSAMDDESKSQNKFANGNHKEQEAHDSTTDSDEDDIYSISTPMSAPITKSTTNDSYALNFKNIFPQDYLELMNKGWRRSGTLIYKPRLWSSCCALIPIRLDVTSFQISHSQKKVLKRLHRALGTSHNVRRKDKSQVSTSKSNEQSGHETKSASTTSSKFKRQKQQVRGGKEWDVQIQSFTKQLLQKHILLERLKLVVDRYVKELFQQNSEVAAMLQNNKKTQKLSSFKCTKITKPKRSTTSPTIPCVLIEATLSTMVCPALHGKSKGAIDRITSAKTIVNMLKQSSLVENEEEKKIGNGGVIKVHEIGFDNKSAHVYAKVIISLEEAMLQSMSHETEEKSDIAMTDDEDIIKAFIESTGGLTKEERETLSPPYRLSIRSVPSQISGCMPSVHRLYCKYQHAVHGDKDPYEGASEEQPASDVETEREEKEEEHHEMLSEANFATAYPQYDRERIKAIHKSYTGFFRFLCSSPLPQDRSPRTGVNSTVAISTTSESFPFIIKDEDVKIPCGSYHQHYLINEKYLFAVCVVDILPACLSSVYAFYDPKLSENLILGKLTALYEIEWVKHALQFRPDLKYYYLGYYIHSCPKMKYKAEYKPSRLLCPVKNVWVDFEVARKRLQERSPIRHCCNISTPDEKYYTCIEDTNKNNTATSGNAKENCPYIDDILFDIGASGYLTMTMIPDEAREIVRPMLEEFVREVGRDVSRKCIVKLCP